MDNFIEIITKFVLIILLLVIIAFLTGVPTMLLWNYLMPYLFGLHKINFWQAICMNLLCSSLFSSSVKTPN